MSSEEIAGIRADYERILNPETCEYTSPKEPDFSEIVGDCDWEQKVCMASRLQVACQRRIRVSEC